MRFSRPTHRLSIERVAVAVAVFVGFVGTGAGCQGGPVTEITFEGPNGADHQQALAVMKTRVAAYGDVVGGEAAGRSILIRVRLKEGAEINKLGEQGALGFHALDDVQMSTIELKPGLKRTKIPILGEKESFEICGETANLPAPKEGSVWATLRLRQCSVLLKPATLTDADVVDATMSEGGVYPAVNIVFSEQGKRKFAALTSELINRPLAIVLDGEVHSTPIIRARIPGGRAMISVANGPKEKQLADAKQLATVLRSNRLPGSYRLIRMELAR